MKRIALFIFALFTSAIAHAATETINWYMDGNTYATTTCQTGGDIVLPQTPYKYGYTFNGWIGYTPIEYLKGTGTQWIDTGYYPNDKTRIQTSVRFNTISNDQAGVCGTSTWMAGNSIGIFTWDNKIQFNNNKVYLFSVTISPDDTAEIDYNKNIIKYSINNVSKTDIVFNETSYRSKESLTLFAVNVYGSTITNAGKINLYYFKIYDNDILVRDFIPVLDTDGTPCMYDKVTKQFFYNAGTGNFIAGPVIQ